MANKLIIIDEEIFEQEVAVSHEEALREYLKIKNLDLVDSKDLTSFQLSLYLASLNIVSIHIENNHHLYYLGNSLTETQYNYFKKNKREFRKYKTSFVNLDNDEQEFYDEWSRPQENIFKTMLEVIEEKPIITQNSQIKS